MVAAIIEATKVAENFMVSIEIPQQRFVGNRLDNERRRRVGGEIVTAPNFSELQVALFGEHTSLAAWTPPCWSLSSHSCFFMRHLLNFVSLVLVIDEGLGFLHLRLVHVFCLSQ